MFMVSLSAHFRSSNDQDMLLVETEGAADVMPDGNVI